MNTYTQRDYLAVENMAVLKGLLAIGVLLSHAIPASGVFSVTLINGAFALLGYLCVSIFFFLSGFGITAQHQRHGAQYLKNFLKLRVLSIYLLNVFLIFVYAIFHMFVGTRATMLGVLRSFWIGSTVVDHGWYLQVVILFYLLWFFCMRFFSDSKAFPALCLCILAYMLIAAGLSWGTTWYECSPAFLLGVAWQSYKSKIDAQLFQKRSWPLVLLFMILFLVSFVFSDIHVFAPNQTADVVLRTFSKCVSSPAFAALIISFLAWLSTFFQKTVAIPVLPYIGRISIEIYVLQAIPLGLFRNVVSGWGYIVCVATMTLALSILLHPLFRFVMSIPKKYLLKNV